MLMEKEIYNKCIINYNDKDKVNGLKLDVKQVQDLKDLINKILNEF